MPVMIAGTTSLRDQGTYTPIDGSTPELISLDRTPLPLPSA